MQEPVRNTRYADESTEDVLANPVSAQPREAIPMPGREQPAVRPGPSRNGIKIALFGPASGGKTTFLQGLLTGQPNRERYGEWTATRVGGDGAGETLDSDLREHAMRGEFPAASTRRAAETWRIQGRYPQAPPPPRRRLLSGTPAAAPRREESFDLTIVDRPGSHSLRPAEEMLQEINDADGLLLLIDPTLMLQPLPVVGDKELDSTVAYLFRMLPDLASHRVNDGGSPRLTQHLAVCVSKFDDPAVYARAKQLGVVDREPTGPPFVPSGDGAQRFFADLCDRSAGPGDFQIPNLLTRFDENRVDYHVVSAVGFYIEPGHDFDEGKFLNVIQRNGKPHIKRQMPLNVWEIVIGLYESIMRERRR
jgi:GTPase SAR1 family protein